MTNDILSVVECARLCEQTKDCNGFDYNLEFDDFEGECYLKQGVTKIIEDTEDYRIRAGGMCYKSGE